jgi:RNA polymerase sigma factor (sigma-70 family)
VSESNFRRIGSLIPEFDVLADNEILPLLVQCIARLPKMTKKVLAFYYYENFQANEIAAALGLTEYEVDQMHSKALGAIQTMLATRLRLQRRAAA